MKKTNLPEKKLKLYEKILVSSRRRCAICFGLENDTNRKKGQIAHLDGNRENNRFDNLAFLCLDHHDEYDSRTSQSKSLQINEVKTYRQELYQYLSQVGSGGAIIESETEPKMDLCIFAVAGGLKDRTIFCERGRPKAVRLINPVEQLITQAQLPCDVNLKHSHPAKLTLHKFIEDGLLISEGSCTNGIVVEMEIYYAWPAPTS